MSYTQTFYHIVLRTHRSVPAIVEEHERELYSYMHGFIQNKRCDISKDSMRQNEKTLKGNDRNIMPKRPRHRGAVSFQPVLSSQRTGRSLI